MALTTNLTPTASVSCYLQDVAAGVATMTWAKLWIQYLMKEEIEHRIIPLIDFSIERKLHRENKTRKEYREMKIDFKNMSGLWVNFSPYFCIPSILLCICVTSYFVMLQKICLQTNRINLQSVL